MKTKENNIKTKIGYLLATNVIMKISEILFLFILGFALIKILKPYAGDNLLLQQLIVFGANIFALIYIWLGIKLRGQKWSDFGLTFVRISLKEGLRIFMLSIFVCILAVSGFILGSIIMANVTGIPESADMSGYEYLQNNIFMLILTLCGVYIVSSFGEEVIYRAFLINRLSELGLDSKYGKMATVVISAVIFGFVHYEWGPMGIVQTGFMGLVMGIFYLKLKKKLWILVLAHVYMDTILLVQVYLASN
jgi:membrane protease YdiL (CAAX protease family)